MKNPRTPTASRATFFSSPPSDLLSIAQDTQKEANKQFPDGGISRHSVAEKLLNEGRFKTAFKQYLPVALQEASQVDYSNPESFPQVTGMTCCDFAIFAIQYMAKKHPDVSAEIVQLPEHTFVVIGRSTPSNPADITTWGERAVCLDIWADRIFFAKNWKTEQQGVPRRMVDLSALDELSADSECNLSISELLQKTRKLGHHLAGTPMIDSHTTCAAHQGTGKPVPVSLLERYQTELKEKYRKKTWEKLVISAIENNDLRDIKFILDYCLTTPIERAETIFRAAAASSVFSRTDKQVSPETIAYVRDQFKQASNEQQSSDKRLVSAINSDDSTSIEDSLNSLNPTTRAEALFQAIAASSAFRKNGDNTSQQTRDYLEEAFSTACSHRNLCGTRS